MKHGCIVTSVQRLVNCQFKSQKLWIWAIVTLNFTMDHLVSCTMILLALERKFILLLLLVIVVVEGNLSCHKLNYHHWLACYLVSWIMILLALQRKQIILHHRRHYYSACPYLSWWKVSSPRCLRLEPPREPPIGPNGIPPNSPPNRSPNMSPGNPQIECVNRLYTPG